MGRCPFGFTAEDEDGGADNAEVINDAEGDTEGPTTANGHGFGNGAADDGADGLKVKGKKKKAKKGGEERFDVDTDPVSWFYQNQIKSEEEFQAKKDLLREEARKRLDMIMDKKNKRLMWPSDSEFDDLSISSGELSELDSDVHSLASLRTVANSWVEDVKYGAPAEQSLRMTGLVALAVCGLAMYTSWSAMQTGQKVMGLIMHNIWPTYALLAAIGLSAGGGLSILATQWRSKKLLLSAQVMNVISYGAATFVGICVWFKPVKVDSKVKEGLCGARSPGLPHVTRMCRDLPTTQVELAGNMDMLQKCLIAMAGLSLLLLAFGTWYTLELCFIEKKAAKHVRRHKRRKHTIPWEKIKIEGPIMNCGAGAGNVKGAKGRAGGGKCPVGFTSKDKSI